MSKSKSRLEITENLDENFDITTEDALKDIENELISNRANALLSNADENPIDNEKLNLKDQSNSSICKLKN